MRSGILRGMLGPVLVASLVSFCLFGDCRTVKASRALGSILGEVGAAISDAGTQWMVFVCAGVYLLAFVVLRRSQVGGGRMGTRWTACLPGDLWLVGLVAVAVLAYAVYYPQVATSTQALTLIGAVMVGQGAGLWESRKQKAETGQVVVGVLSALLLGAAVWQGEMGHLFQYRGQARWSGPWDNPNTSAMMMGVGVVLAVGRLVQNTRWKVRGPKSKVQSRPNAECGVRSGEWGPEHRTSNVEHRTLNWWLWLTRVFFLVAAGVMGLGLVKSYSRGAWVGAVVALAHLAFHIGKAEKLKTERLKGGWCGGKAESGKQKAEIPSAAPVLRLAGRRWVALASISVSVGVLVFWSCRHTERAVARRAYTVANANDFS